MRLVYAMREANLALFIGIADVETVPKIQGMLLLNVVKNILWDINIDFQ